MNGNDPLCILSSAGLVAFAVCSIDKDGLDDKGNIVSNADEGSARALEK
jgi:hypothetical protein